jgi:predicted nuclease of predicted toxin-antitoxin system
VKLLLDQNISYRLVKKIEAGFAGSQHISQLGLTNKSDRDIWEAAKSSGFVIVTFDADFYDLSLTLGHPPKLIWIRSGNTTTKNLERLLTQKRQQITDFVEDSNLACLEIDD